MAEAIINRLARNREKYELYVYTMQGYSAGYVPPANVHLINIPVFKGKHLRPLTLGLLSALHALFKGNYNLVHLHNVEMSFTLPLLRLRYKVITTSHGYQVRPKWSPIVKIIWQLMDIPFLWISNIATAVSSSHQDYYYKKYKKNVVYIPNGTENLPVNKEKARSLLQKYGIVNKPFLLLAAGRIIPSKGCHFALKAYLNMKIDMPFVIVGDLDQVPEYTRELKRMGKDKVTFIPLIEEKDVLFGLISLARLFIFPSTMEASSMALLEVASLGVPLLASDIPENLALMKDHTNYFKSGKIIDLENKLKYCLENLSELREKALQTQEWVRKNYDWDHITRQYEKLYKNLMDPE
ncbi:glycosyltransferase family 4 protein [bacterium]|nr:glycosyltransferase family 4 protein [bacterium]